MFIDMWRFVGCTPAGCYVVPGQSAWGGAHSTPRGCGHHLDHGSINIPRRWGAVIDGLFCPPACLNHFDLNDSLNIMVLPQGFALNSPGGSKLWTVPRQ